jgi:hypothetical protein
MVLTTSLRGTKRAEVTMGKFIYISGKPSHSALYWEVERVNRTNSKFPPD